MFFDLWTKIKKYESLNREKATSAHVVLKYTDKEQKFSDLKNQGNFQQGFLLSTLYYKMEYLATPVYSTFSYSVCSSNSMHKNVSISEQLKAEMFTGNQ